MAKAFGEIEASAKATALTHPEWLGLLLDRESAIGVISACSLGCATPGRAIKLPSRTSITAPVAVSIVLSSVDVH